MIGPDYIVSLSGQASAVPGAPGIPGAPGGGRRSLTNRPWLAVRWRCCSVYSRVYRNLDATAYTGRCPRCGKAIHIPVGPGGTSNRFFEAQ